MWEYRDDLKPVDAASSIYDKTLNRGSFLPEYTLVFN